MRIVVGGCLFLTSFMSFSANVQTVDVAVTSKQFEIVLPANPTTGYQWTVKKYDKAHFILMSSRFQASSTKRMGAGGQISFIFSKVKHKNYPKTTIIIFNYSRAWDPSTSTVKQVVVNFIK